MGSRPIAAAVLALCASIAWTIGRTEDIPFEKHSIDLGANEACTVADINGDGRLDIVSGENWYEGPRWIKHKFRSISFADNYIDNFSDLAIDVNGDGSVDIVTPQGWFEAPADPRNGAWKWHPDFNLGAVGFMYVLDVNGDGRNDIVTSMAHDYGIFRLEQGEGGKWTKHMIDD